MVKKKTNHTNKIFMLALVFIVVILAFSVYRTTAPANDADIPIAGNSTDFWQQNITDFRGNNQLVQFHYSPGEVENVTVPEEFKNNFNDFSRDNTSIGIGIDSEAISKSEMALAGVEISKVSGRLLGINTTSGTLLENQSERTYNCDLASDDLFVFELRLGNESNISSQPNCLSIEFTEGSDDELLQSASAVVFTMLDLI